VNDERRLNLRDSLNLVDSLLTTPAMSLMLSLENNDPLRLNLPPISGSGSSSLIPDATTLKVMASLYFQSELEQAGIIAVAELLSESRFELKVYGERSARLLEDFYRKKRDWYDRKSREHIFARIFGTGGLAKNEEGNLINRDFQSKFAEFCLSLWRYADGLRFQKTPSPMLDAAFRQSATNLLMNLGVRRYGDIYEASRRIQNQLSKSIELLEDEGVGNMFQTRGMWNVLRAVLNENLPDFARLTTRGQSGLRLLTWLTTINLESKDYKKPLLEGNSPVMNWAEMWLESSGFDVRQMNYRRLA
jgi:hypothetical protein